MFSGPHLFWPLRFTLSVMVPLVLVCLKIFHLLLLTALLYISLFRFQREKSIIGLLFRLQLQCSQLEGKGESSLYATHGSPSSWVNQVSLWTERQICCWRQHLKSLTWLCTTACWRKYGSLHACCLLGFFIWVNPFFLLLRLKEVWGCQYKVYETHTLCENSAMGSVYTILFDDGDSLWGTCWPHFDEAET